MRFATLRDDSKPDGFPCLVHPGDNTAVQRIPTSIAESLLDIVSRWDAVHPALKILWLELCDTRTEKLERVLLEQFTAPLPRTWAFFDGSAYLNHVLLARKARGAAPPPELERVPLMYQGASDNLLGPCDPIICLDRAYDYDFEGEFCVVTGPVACSTQSADTLESVRLILLMNDISLRALVPSETGTGFGFIQSKPPSAFAPIAITPDELGSSWEGGRLHLQLTVRRNDTVVGQVNAEGMHFSFADLIAHACCTRPLSAGTIIGSGTVSESSAEAGSCCIAEQRAREIIQSGAASTTYLQPGDQVEMQSLRDGQDIFGLIRQTVKTA